MRLENLKKDRQEFYNGFCDGMSPKAMLKRMNDALANQLKGDDAQIFNETVGDYILWYGLDKVAEKTSIPANQLMSLYSFHGYPTMNDVMKIFNVLDLSLSIAPDLKVSMN